MVIAHPVLMALAVTATGNHYLVDSLAGALVALLALVAVDAWQPCTLATPFGGPGTQPCRLTDGARYHSS